MKIILNLILTALVVFILSKLLPGIIVDNYITAIIVAFTISVLNTFVRPVLVFFTLPITILTLGLFRFVINAIIVLLASWLISDFFVNGIVTAVIFSVLLSVFKWLLLKFIPE